MKKYSKGKMRFKRFGVVLAILLALILIAGIILLVCFCFKNKIEKLYISSEATNVSDDIALNSSPIVVNNLVVGALYDKKWVSATKYYLKSKNKSNLDIEVYTKESRAGSFKLKDTYTQNDSIYINTSYSNYIDEYFAVPANNTFSLSSQFDEVEIEEKDYDFVKKALGIYRAYNSSISISKVYSGFINSSIPVRIITVTSSKKGIFGGVYSAVILALENNNKAQIVEYNYTKDFENSEDFPLHSVITLADLNNDGNSELVTMSVTEFDVIYKLFEYRDNKYVQVLSETIKGK